MKKKLFYVFFCLFVSGIIFSQDTTPPDMVCKNITIALDSSGNASITADQVDGGSTDNIGLVSLIIDQQDFECIHVGDTTVTLTGTDAAGNSAFCTAIVTVIDTIDPNAICNMLTLELDDMGFVNVNASDLGQGSSDNCDYTYHVSSESFDCTSVGVNTVTLTVTDSSENESICITTINIEDNIPPVPLCSNYDLRLDETGNGTVEAMDIDGGSTDACEISSVSITKNSFDCSNLGDNEVTLTVTDANGNSSECIAIISVEDGTDPIAICQDITLSLDESGVVSISEVDIDGGSSDDCSGIDSYEIDTSEFDCGFIGDNTVTLTVTDFYGNSSTCTSNVTIKDNSSSTVFCNDLIIQLDETGVATITPEDLDGGSEGGCGEVDSLEVNIEEFDCSHIGTNLVELTVNYTNGSSSSCYANVTVEDTTAPTMVCRDITVQLDETGNVSIDAEDIDNGSNDTCGIVAISVSPDSFSCVDIGNNNVMLMAEDTYGNIASCSANVLVVNNSVPMALCQDITVQLDASGNASINANEVDQGSTDPCGIASVSVVPTDFTCNDIGTNTVVLTVTNYNGESATCEASVTIEDATAPIAICQNITIQLDEMGYASIASHYIDNGSSDDCSGIENLELDIYDFDCNNIGENTVELTVYDSNGNPSYCNAIVTVEDITVPNALCQDITLQLDDTGYAFLYPEEIDYGSEDACEIVSITASPDSFSCANIGNNTVTLTITDSNNNKSTCLATVIIEDTELPIARCHNITIQLDEAGTATITPDEINNNSEDLCGLQILEVTPNSFTSAHIGPNNVTLLVTDTSGNQSTCAAVVTIKDHNTPTTICRDITVQLDETGLAVITAQDISSENNTAASFSLDITEFDCTHIGNNKVTMTMTDGDRKSSNCIVNVFVEDKISPTFDASTFPTDKEVTINLSNNYILEDFTSHLITKDNCSTDITITQSPHAGSSLNKGHQQIVFTAIDASGNTATKTLTITINQTPERFIIYPNPASETVTVEAFVNKVQLFNMKGRMVFESSTASFNIATLQSGIYFVRIEPEKNDILMQLIKK